MTVELTFENFYQTVIQGPPGTGMWGVGVGVSVCVCKKERERVCVYVCVKESV